MTLTPRERVRLALDHREPDRIPIDLGGTFVTSVTKAAYLPLRAHLGLPLEDVRISDEVQQLPFLTDDLLERFRADTRLAWLPPRNASTGEVIDDGEYWAMYDRWGTKRRMPKAGGLYYDLVEVPIKECTMAGLDAYRWPDPEPPELFAELGEVAKRLHETTDRFIVGGRVGGSGLFEQCWQTAGFESFLVAMAVDRPFSERLMDGILERYLESVDRYLDAVGAYIDAFAFGDDVCGQDGWLFSPELFATLVKPRYRRLFDTIRAKTKAKIFFHSCGAVFDLIPHLIDVGVDILNPIQLSARGMGSRRLKAAYGRDITFWGGGVDTQQVLPFGTPEQVRDEVRRRIDELAPGGGFVFSAVHNIQAFVPPENIVAAFDEAFAYGRYGAPAGAQDAVMARAPARHPT